MRRGSRSSRYTSSSAVYRDDDGFFRGSVVTTFKEMSALDRVRRLVSSLEDRRTWYPSVLRPAVASVRSASRIRNVVQHSVYKRKVAFLNSGLVFAEPFRVAICVKRKVRKEVLHALRVAGKGGAKRKNRRTDYSGVRC